MFSPMIAKRVLAFVVTAALGQAAFAQCNVFQPWTKPSDSFTSIVRSCDQPVTPDRVAMDDFICREQGKLDRLRWWGVVFSREQALRGSYYIAIYEDNGNCEPGNQVYKACVRPQVKLAGVDCKQNRVIQFDAALPNPFPVQAGVRYWLQISEDDSRSFRPGVEDFRWSGHQPVKECEALQIDTMGNIIQPLIDSCNQRPSDLAFAFRLQ